MSQPISWCWKTRMQSPVPIHGSARLGEGGGVLEADGDVLVVAVGVAADDAGFGHVFGEDEREVRAVADADAYGLADFEGDAAVEAHEVAAVGDVEGSAGEVLAGDPAADFDGVVAGDSYRAAAVTDKVRHNHRKLTF